MLDPSAARPAGRIIYSRGPWIRTLLAIDAILTVLTIVALVVSVGTNSARISDLQRVDVHFCRAFQAAVIAATPPGKQAKARAFLARTPFAN